MKKLYILVVSVFIFFSFASEKESKQQWFKGNTHCHSSISDGDSAPWKVVKAYHDRGYNFLMLTDHNFLVPHDTIKKPRNLRNDFIMIPGEEVTDKNRYIPLLLIFLNMFLFTATKNEAPNHYDRLREIVAVEAPTNLSKTDLLQLHVNGILKAGGIPFLNHPNFAQGLQVSDILPVSNLHHIEIYNGHPSVANWGKEGHISVEAKWDELLSSGMLIYGVAADDMHDLNTKKYKDAGMFRGWVMVNSKELSTKAIHKAILNGDFYATNSVTLKTCQLNKKECVVEIDVKQTQKEIADSDGIARIDYSGTEGYTIEFIGNKGRVLAISNETKASYQPKKQTNMYELE